MSEHHIPWRTNTTIIKGGPSLRILDRHGRVICTVHGRKGNDKAAFASRIVACVNALSDIHDPAKFVGDAKEDIPALITNLRQQAEIHAMEAKTQRATVYECYQAICHNQGEPGSWNGAEPVRAYVEKMEAALKQAQKALAVILDPKMQHISLVHVWAQCTEAEAKARAVLNEGAGA